MKLSKSLIALTVVLAASACDRSAPPTATFENDVPSLAGSVGRVKSFRIPTDNSQPRHITLGSDGNMWFTEGNVGQIGVIDADGNITEFVTPDPFTSPDDIVSGPDGALWFTIPNGFPDAIGRVTTGGQFTTFGTCTPEECSSIVPNGITSGPDGNIWFTEFLRNAIVKLEPSGVFTFYPLPNLGANPSGITVGPDGALWFAEFHGDKIGRFDLATGTFTEHGPVIGPQRITVGPDAALWFTQPFNNTIGRLDPLTGSITEFPLPSPGQPRDIVAGPDGKLWFTLYNAGQLANITTDGVVTLVQRVRGGPWGIGRGAGNTIWFTQFDGNKVSRFTLNQ
jgi:virginiamycin B lyase